MYMYVCINYTHSSNLKDSSLPQSDAFQMFWDCGCQASSHVIVRSFGNLNFEGCGLRKVGKLSGTL